MNDTLTAADLTARSRMEAARKARKDIEANARRAGRLAASMAEAVDRLTVRELRSLAVEFGVKGAHRMNRDALRAAVTS